MITKNKVVHIASPGNARHWMHALCLAAAPLAAAPLVDSQCANSGITPSSPPLFFSSEDTCTSTSVSYTTSLATHTAQLDQRVDQYKTQITANLYGSAPIYDVSFNLPYTHPTVQNAVLAAQSALLAVSSPLTFTGPNLVSSSVDFVESSSNTVIDSQVFNTFLSFENTIGPEIIHAGDRGTCDGVIITGTYTGVPFGCTPGLGTPFVIAGNTSNVNSNFHGLTEIFQTTTTTDTFLTSEHYNLVGSPPQAVSIPTLSLSGLWIAVLGLAAIAARSLRRQGHYRLIYQAKAIRKSKNQ